MKTEQNKLEQEFKSKLEERTIQPSSAAWDRLDAMLSVAENESIPDTDEKKKPQRLWLYIAASFVAFLLVGVLLLNMQPEVNNPTITIDENAVVNNQQNNATPTEGNNVSNVTTNNTTGNEIINESSIPVQKQAVTAVTTKESNATSTQSSKGAQHPVNKITSNSIENITQNDKLLATVNESPLNKRGNDDITVGETKIKTNGITVDANKLLASVEVEENKKQQIEYTINQGKTKIDSKQLLSSVEEELDQSFRSKVLQSAVKQYNVIKTSVANRNYQ
ncbi:hypothetical protein GCM10007424_22990 [Flavobacterium suaedae]|uniref:Anti-sigma factor n=1 Tax=Flavobacterium suaedae TaxID=1767027 RepID=A0ABQ1K2Z8_9FLAO|nr:hypothetical protein [Flavobacterium suaedae]GGB82369.1 hypothetical protein GCM10007424_22990 [Flavobacterium suaedae]